MSSNLPMVLSRPLKSLCRDLPSRNQSLRKPRRHRPLKHLQKLHPSRLPFRIYRSKKPKRRLHPWNQLTLCRIPKLRRVLSLRLLQRPLRLPITNLLQCRPPNRQRKRRKSRRTLSHHHHKDPMKGQVCWRGGVSLARRGDTSLYHKPYKGWPGLSLTRGARHTVGPGEQTPPHLFDSRPRVGFPICHLRD